MPFFSKVFKSKDSGPAGRGRQHTGADVNDEHPPKPKFEDAWARHWVASSEVDELLHVCTQEMVSRALDMPFLLLPFRPSSDPSAARTFIRNYFKTSYGPSAHLTGDKLKLELKLIEPLVLCSIMKWCWSRLNGGVVTWNTYNLFKKGELQSKMAKHAFDTFIPLSAKDEAHKNIICDFFDLLAAIAANGKKNGLGGRKLSRLAGWWAFELSDNGQGFDGGYRSWESAADASSHLFFAYLRSLAPDAVAGTGGISKLSRSLQALVAQTEYPPEAPTLLQTRTPKVVMLVDSVSPTPYALLRRTKHFEYRDDDVVLQRFSRYDDPVQALTFECRRVLDAISSTNQSVAIHTEAQATSPTDASWSRFEDLGFSSLIDDNSRISESSASPRFSSGDIRSQTGARSNDFGRPTTPSWGEFLAEGFSDDATSRGPASLLLPPDQMLPPISPSRLHSSQSNMTGIDENLEPGELASIGKLELDETFWWVWMTSLAGEEPSQRKAVFGRCAFIETEISSGRWVVIEEKLKTPDAVLDENAYIAEKKSSRSLFSRSRRTRRQSTTGRKTPSKKMMDSTNDSIPPTPIPAAPEQQAKVEAAANALLQQQYEADSLKSPTARRSRREEGSESKHNSVMTLQPVIMKEAGPAMQWARKFDKETIRAKYLGDDLAGKGLNRPPSSTFGPSDYGRSPMEGIPPAEPSVPAVLANMEKPLPAVANAEEKLPDPSQGPPLPPPPKGIENDATIAAAAAVAASPTAPRTPVKSHRKEESEATVVDKDVVSPSALNHTHRKPVSVDKTERDHPALRNAQAPKAMTKKDDSALPPARPVNAAAAAAAAAAASKVASQQQKPAPTTAQDVKSKKGSTRVINRMFGRKPKTEDSEPEAIARHRQMMGGTSDKPLGRKPSLLRRNKTTSRPETPSAIESKSVPSAPLPVAPAAAPAAPAAVVPVSHAQHPGPTVMQPQMSDLEYGEPGPDQMTEELEHGTYEPEATHHGTTGNLAHPNTSVSQFSNFTQGPLDDQPAFAADDEDLDRDVNRPVSPISQTESMSARSFNTRAGARLYQQDPESPMTALPSHGASQGAADMTEHVDERSDADVPPFTVPDNSKGSGDRWAQIRRNAAERRTSDDHVSRPSQSVRTEKTDDGETSGEETIEQRVARIKARVAELTAGSTSPTSAHA